MTDKQKPDKEPDQPGRQGQSLRQGPRDAEHLDGARKDVKLDRAVERQLDEDKRRQSRPQD